MSASVIAEPPPSLNCEIAVVGSGPGGAITACLLAEAGKDVLLIEEGPFLGVDSCAPFTMAEMEQKYRNGGLTVAMGPVKVQYVEGRCVGGGSEINSGLYHRTPADILAQWTREFQVDALDEKSMQPHFEACERDLGVGLMPGPVPLASLKLHEGAQRLSWKSLEVPRWFSYENGSAQGRRKSMTESYIPRALRAGCRLLPQVRVRRLVRQGSAGSWTLEAERAGPSDGTRQPVRITARSVFSCAGAVHTPALLRRSGIKAHVGDSLRLHPMIKLVARFPERVNWLDMGVPVHQVKEFTPRMSFGGSVSTPAYLALGMNDHRHGDVDLLHDWQKMAVYYAATLSKGQGSVRCLPGFRDPVVGYRITDEDLRDLSQALRRLSELLFAAGADRLYPSIVQGPGLRSPADLAQLSGNLPRARTNLMTVHLFSSCPMGEDRQRCAADSFGKVHGQQDLYIADASLLCTAPGVNPQGSIMAIARRNALRFLGVA